ncbi:neural precursor cell expressed, developmentally down-regulated 1 [Penaeus vannamei]|uniref:Neural cell expressed, developmentally down-regulated 1 n=1 Tax=Penaeus vannamei TaxID=6689 RepID=A0A3R7QGZ2_PENVA|nr:protein NEDD1-like isoform X3 [Penaeus vannamei]XP_027209489.1 protein NEDD1-like isoform X3 [Penaeus vannamei]XP_027209490.1 protein NEDD1-like isoform X3 [Penaeus vannamei]ROT78535.1 neural precursor cell expressed, developmentally down-regulated 1 [Penaeus vannamei]
MLATAGDTVKLWNTQNYSLYQEIPSVNGRVIGLTWNQDGQCLAGLGETGDEIILSAINAKSAAMIGVVRGMDSPSCIKFASRSPHYLGIGSKDGSVAIWNVKSQAQKKVFAVTDTCITKISFSHNDSHIAAASKKGAIFLLSVVNNSSAGPFKVFDNKAITDLAYSRAKKFLLGCCSDEGSVSLFDSHANKVIHSFKGAHSSPAASVSFSPVNELLMISVGYDKKFACYNVQTKQPLMTHRSSAPLTSAAFLSGGQQVALGTMTGQVFIHDLRTLRTPLATVPAHTKAVTSIIVQPATRSASESSAGGVKKNSKLKNNIEGQTSHKTSKSCSDQPSGGSQADPSVKKKTALAPATSVDPSHDVLSPDVFSPIRSTENPVKMNIEQVKKFTSLERHGSRDSLGMDDVLSPVRPITHAPETAVSPHTLVVASHNVDDDIFSPVRGASSNTGLPKISAGMFESYKGHDCEDDLLSPIRYRSNFRQQSGSTGSASPNIPQITTSDALFDELPIPQNENSKDKENVQPSDAGKPNNNSNAYNKGTPVRATHLEEASPASVLSLHNQVNDVKAKNTSSAKKPNNIITSETKTMQNVTTTEVSKTPELMNPLNRHSHTKKTESPADLPSQAAKLYTEDATTPSRYQYTRSSPPHKRAFLRPVHTSDLFSPADGTVDQIQVSGTPKQELSADVPKPGSDGTHVLQVDLIRNCMAEVLEEYQDDINRRLMHLQCVVMKQFLKQQEIMEQLHRQYSLNEDLLQENERLRQEVKHLKANY